MALRRLGVLAALVAAVFLVVCWQHGVRTAHDGSRSASPTTGGHRTSRARQATGGRRVAGTVLLDGAPVAGATVVVVGLQAHAQVQSDARGGFEVRDVRGTEVVVAAEKAGLAGSHALVQLGDPGDAPEHVTLAMHACTASLYGKIVDADGGPIVRARIAAGDGAILAGGAESGDDGSYRLCVPVGDTGVQVWAEGYARVQDLLFATGPVHRDFALVPEAAIAGRVVRATDRAPVAGARVTATADDDRATTFEAITDDDGRFRIAGAGPARYAVSAIGEHQATAVDVPLIADVGSANETELVLVPTASVSGTVRAAGTPVAGASVRLAQHRELPTAGARTVLTQADGSFEIDNVLPGDFTVNVDHFAVKTPATVEVAHADVRDVAVEVEPETSIAGVVMFAGKPVDGADVSVRGAYDKTDASGHFMLHGVRPGTLRVYAESKRVGAFTKGPEVTVAAGEQRTGVEVDMDLSGSIAGTVVDQDGAPVRGVVVRFSLLHGADYGVATTAEDGSFTATALSGGGSYVYEVRESEWAVTPLAPVEGRRFPPVALRDGHSQVTGLQIKVRRTALSIAGTVRTTTGQPVADVRVEADVNDYQRSSAYHAMTDASGAFAIRDVPAGTYTIVASNARSHVSLESIAAGRADLAIVLPAPATIEGTLDGFSQPPAVRAMSPELDRPLAAEIAGAQFIVRDVPPGRYWIAASALDGDAEATVEVAAGARVQVVLHRQGFGSVAGTFTAANGDPIAGARCQVGRVWTTVTTDASGMFRFDKLPADKQMIMCMWHRDVQQQTVDVVAGREARVALVASGPPPAPPHGHAGFTLEDQLGEVVVGSVEPDGPAARAGIQAGDVIVELEHTKLGRMGGYALELVEMAGPGTVVHLLIEQGDTTRNVDLTLGP